LCHALQKRGKQDCKQHFVIWEWGRLGDNNERRFSKYHYIMMMVTKEPIDQETRGAIKGWIECCLLMPRNKRGNNEIVANLIYFNADFHGAKSLNVSLWDCPGFARKFGKFATETLIGLFCQVWF
jgi:hypothetical protein